MKRRGLRALSIGGVLATFAILLFFVPPVRQRVRQFLLDRALTRLAQCAAGRAITTRMSIASKGFTRAGHFSTRTTPASALYASAADVLRYARDDDSQTARHASALAYYYAGRLDDAIRTLGPLAKQTARADVWNDLAAVRLDAAMAGGKPHEMVSSLVAIETALRIDPLYSPALFNRALILERMGLSGHAARAWRLASIAEQDGSSRQPILERLRVTNRPTDDAEFERLLVRLERHPADSEGLRSIVRRFAQQSRLAAETVLPCEWGAALLVDDAAGARRKLDLARSIAAELRRLSGESFAYESISRIDEATRAGAGQRLMRLAKAYVEYREGRLLLRDDAAGRAETQLRQAAEAFGTAGSPMEKAARYYTAMAIAEQNRIGEAASLNADIEREAASTAGRHRALAASAAWQTARYQAEMGHWDRAVIAATASAADFRTLGEVENSGAMENMLAELYDRLEQPERAWKHRIAAFELLSRAGAAYRLQVALAAPSRDAIRHEEWSAAIVLLGLEVEHSRFVGSPLLLAESLSRRARAHAAHGDHALAQTDIRLGRSAAALVTDEALRTHLQALLDAAEGAAVRDRDPLLAERLLTSAIDFHRRAERALVLPELLLERGRIHLRANRQTAALSDFEAGITEFERQRSGISDYELSSTLGDAGSALYVEVIRIAVGRGDAHLGFEYSERSRGRALADRLGLDRIPTHVTPNSVLIQYMSLPELLVAFVVDDDIRMIVLPITRERLSRAVDELTAAIVGGRPIEEVLSMSGSLHDVLLRPLAVPHRPTTIIVASGVLERVPWSVLYDRAKLRYVVEETTVLQAPSAAYALAPPTKIGVPQSAFVVGDPVASTVHVDLPPLPAAVREAEAVAASYRRARLLVRHTASRARFSAEAKDYDVIHFGGHAISSDAFDDQSFLVLAPDRPGTSGLLFSRDIANLPLDGVHVVVLAACGTIRGSAMRAEGVPSIGRAFLAAGARSVIGTLWDVEDRNSADLFIAIHQSIANGVAVGDAVRDAQLRALRSGSARLMHPRAWGSVVVLGGFDDRADVQPRH